MVKLGYIISQKKQPKMVGFVENVSTTKDIDSTKPTLIVGWKQAQKDSDFSSILHKKMTENKFWTFSRTEKRSEYEEDLESFYKFCVNEPCKTIRYYYINPFVLSFRRKKQLYNILFHNSGNICHIDKNILYVYRENYVLGISFEILSYCGIDIRKFYSRLYKNKNNVIYKDDNEQIIEFKRYLEPKNKYIIPYLMSL